MKMQSEQDNHKISSFIESFLSTEIKSINRLPASGNNRAYCVLTDVSSILVKEYFSHPSDPRDRLSNEFTFLTYAAMVAPEFVPTPLGVDVNQRMAAFEFIKSVPVTSNSLTGKDIYSAAEFFCLLNQEKYKEYAKKLQNASDACFCIASHLKAVGNRIDHLRSVADHKNDSINQFMSNLSDVWIELERAAYRWSKENSISLDYELGINDRCISPSDFGFHNALRRDDGSLVFIDFEYAGWDDPARMCADFFSQPKVPIPKMYYGAFRNQCLSIFPSCDLLTKLVFLMHPICYAKWCCIIAGVIDPVVLERRLFAYSNLDKNTIINQQLIIANRYINTLRKMSNDLH
jgi:hypothetical protein